MLIWKFELKIQENKAIDQYEEIVPIKSKKIKAELKLCKIKCFLKIFFN